MKKKKKPAGDGIVFSTDPSFISTKTQPEIGTLPASQQKLIIKLDTKHRAGKAVTLILGFIGNVEDLEKLGKSIKNFCGTGGSVKDDEILVQGDQRDKTKQWLQKNGYTQTRII